MPKTQNLQPTTHVVVRFPPSPTGELHIGNIRTLLFNYLFARHHGGEIVMRFEDTDRERSKREYEESALQTLAALGLDFDKGPYRQSERGDQYSKAIEALIEGGTAYEGEESHSASSGQARSTSGGQAKDGSGEKVIRFKNPNKELTFNDVIRGEITIDTTDFGDFIIARSKRDPVYHLTVVVDDIDMGVTHVIRGEDHITSTPRQMLLIEALGADIPIYAHLPLIIGEDKKKLGKRHGAVTYNEFEALGYLPEAIVNYLALLGWNPGDEREVFSKEELIKEFSLERVGKSPAMFSYEKLDSINRHYMLALDEQEYENRVMEFLPPQLSADLKKNQNRLRSFIHLVLRDRLHKFAEVSDMASSGELEWLISAADYDTKKITWKDTSADLTKTHLVSVYDMLKGIEADVFSAENTKNTLWGYALENGKGEVLWPMRFALTGMEKSPDPFAVANILGKEETLHRLEYAIAQL
jgi:glutamyl-tRNA synthetase